MSHRSDRARSPLYLAGPALALMTGGGALVVVLDSPAEVIPAATEHVAVAIPPPPSPCTDRVGPPVLTPTGAMQVLASVTIDGQVCSVRARRVPDGTPRSIRINNWAVPLLNEQALDASALVGAAVVDGVSGATFTSSAYRTSLQAILDSPMPAVASTP